MPRPRSAPVENYDLGVEKLSLILHVTVLIENAMIDQGVSRAEMARRMGVSAPHVTQLLSGERNLTLSSVSEMLYHLGLRLDAKVTPC